jgi:hypothetical protein
MASEIINRVANSALVTINLEDLYPEGSRYAVDISQWLHEGLILKEKEYRKAVQEQDWSQYKGGFVALHCSTDAIVPAWAYMLVSVQLSSYAKKIVIGSPEDLETVLYSEIIDKTDLSEYKDKPVIIKGCTHKPVPPNAYIFLTQKLQPIAKSIMYGEACSSVPLFKRKKQ